MDMQPWVTIKGTASTSGVIQELDKWIETSRYQLGILQAESLYMSGGTLYVEDCDLQGGSFATHATYAAGASVPALTYLNKNVPYGAGNRLSNLIRWRFISSGGAWEVSFRLTLVLK